MFKTIVTIASMCVILGAGYFGAGEYRVYKNQQANAVDRCIVKLFDKRQEYRLNLNKYSQTGWMYLPIRRNKVILTEIDKPGLQEVMAEQCQVLDQDMERAVKLVKTIAQSNLTWINNHK